MPESKRASESAPAPSSADVTAVAILLAGTLTLADAVDRALATHPSVAAARAGTDAAKAGVGEAKAAWWPSLSLSGSAMYWQEPMLVTPIHGFRPSVIPDFDETLFNVGLHLRSTLFDGGGRGARIDMARAQEEGADAQLREAEQALIDGVAVAYLTALDERTILAAHDSRIAALEAEADRARKVFDAGRAARVEVLRAEATLESARALRAGSVGALDVATRDLARWISASPEETAASLLVGAALADSTIPARDSTWESAMRASPTRVRSERELEAARARGSAGQERALARPPTRRGRRRSRRLGGRFHRGMERRRGAPHAVVHGRCAFQRVRSARKRCTSKHRRGSACKTTRSDLARTRPFLRSRSRAPAW